MRVKYRREIPKIHGRGGLKQDTIKTTIQGRRLVQYAAIQRVKKQYRTRGISVSVSVCRVAVMNKTEIISNGYGNSGFCSSFT